LMQRLGLELPAGVIMMLPGLVLLAGRAPRVASGRRAQGTGLFLAFVGLGLVGLGLGEITRDHAWHRLGAPAIVMIWLYLLRGVIHPSRSEVLRRVRQRTGRVRMWLVCASLWMMLVLLVGLFWASITGA
jgi:hypothetical protein